MSTEPDVLGLKTPKWNTSIAIPYNSEKEETFERKLMRIKLGLIEYRMPRLNKKHIEIGTNSRNDYTGWNYDSNTNFS